jgi:hypothetical protein
MLRDSAEWHGWKSVSPKGQNRNFREPGELLEAISSGIRGTHDADWDLGYFYDLAFVARDARGHEEEQTTIRRASSMGFSKRGYLSHRGAVQERAGALCEELIRTEVVCLEERLYCALSQTSTNESTPGEIWGKEYAEAQLWAVLAAQGCAVSAEAFQALLVSCVKGKYLRPGSKPRTYQVAVGKPIQLERGTLKGTYARCLRSIEIWQKARQPQAWKKFSVKLPSLEAFSKYDAGWLWPKDFSTQPIAQLVSRYNDANWELKIPSNSKTVKSGHAPCPQNFGLVTIISPASEDAVRFRCNDSERLPRWREEAAYSILLTLFSKNDTGMKLRPICGHLSTEAVNRFWSSDELSTMEHEIRRWAESTCGTSRFDVTLFAGSI